MAYRVAYSNKMKHLPNQLSLLRIALTLVIFLLFVWNYNEVSSWSLWGADISGVYLSIAGVFLVAAITDSLDGYVARKMKIESNLGKFLDPIADKFLVNITLIMLTVQWAWLPITQYVIPVWVVALMLARDLLVDGLRLIASEKKVVLAANIFGKVKTFLQMVAILAILTNDLFFNAWTSALPVTVTEGLLYLALAASWISGVIYFIRHGALLKD